MPSIIPKNRDPIERLLALLKGVKKTGKGWIALCPAHADNDPSLSVSRGADGRALLNCFAGCETKDIVAAVGMTLADLFPAGANGKRENNDKPTGNSYPTWEAALNVLGFLGQRSGTWHYYDAGGNLVAVVGRWDKDANKEYRPVSKHGAVWKISDPPGPWPLYRLPEITATKECPIVIVEGEKCAAAATSIGLPATTSAHGAQSPGKTDWTPLAGQDALIFRANDPAGTDYACAVVQLSAVSYQLSAGK